MPSTLKRFLSLSVGTFLLLLLIHIGLPAIFLLLQVPSFSIGIESIWIMRWENTADRSGIQFNILFLIVTAIGVGLIGALVRWHRSPS
jgi:hypothetical protein